MIDILPQLVGLAVSTNFSKQPRLPKLLGASRAYWGGKADGICLCFDFANTMLQWRFGNVPKGWADVRMACWFQLEKRLYMSA